MKNHFLKLVEENGFKFEDNKIVFELPGWDFKDDFSQELSDLMTDKFFIKIAAMLAICKKLESPIERKFFITAIHYLTSEFPILYVGEEEDSFALIYFDQAPAGLYPEFGLKIIPQKRFNFDGKTFIADFSFEKYFPGKDHSEILCIVELDGHDFHNRTKDQVCRDKKRDRAFLNNNIFTFRFSGSEVFKKCESCISEMESFLTKSLKLY